MKIQIEGLIVEPADVYHAKAKDFLSAHALNEFRRCPLLYHKKELGLVPERDTTAYLVGRAAHTLILESRDKYEREYAIGGPINPKTNRPFGSQTKAFSEWAERQDRAVLSDTQAAHVEEMAAAVKRHPIARRLFRRGLPERVIRAQYVGVWCQARIDWLATGDEEIAIVDLKTVDDLDTFEQSARAFGYVYQVAFYRALLRLVSPRFKCATPVYIIAAEKREPYRTGVWEITSGALVEAIRVNERLIVELQQCQEDGNWFTRYEELRFINHV